MEEIRAIREDELNELVEFLARAYGYKSDYFPRHYPHLYHRDMQKRRNNFVIRDGRRIVSHVGLFPMDILVGRTVFKVGGIGGVGTDPDYRGRGLMRRLLEFVIEVMQKQGYAFSVLWGDRQRYGNFGWELGGRKILFKLTERSLMWRRVKIDTPRRYIGTAEELDQIIGFHEKERLKVRRSRKVYQLLMERPGIEVWLGKKSYMVLRDGNSGIESGGSPSGILSLALGLIKEKGLEYLTVLRPYEYSGINKSLFEASSVWSIDVLCSIKVIDFYKTLEGFKDVMRYRRYPKLPENEREMIERLVLPDITLFDFYIWELDQV